MKLNKNTYWKLAIANVLVLVAIGASAQLAKHFWDVVIDNSLTVGGVTPSNSQWGHVSTMDQDVATTSDVEHNLLQFPEIATPATPASNKNKIYFKADGNAYRLDDAGIEKKLGSGGGGSAGIDLLAELNGNCEDGDPPISWVDSGSALTAESVSPGIDSQSCSIDFSAAAQTVQTAVVTIPDALKGQACAAEFWLNNPGTAGDVTIKIEDSSNVVIEPAQDLPVTSGWQKQSVGFICPDSGDMRVEYEAVGADPADFLVDNQKLGELALVDVSQASYEGSIRWEATTNCQWPSTQTVTFADVPVDADCPAPSATGNLSAPSTTNASGFNVNWGPGVYQIHMNANPLLPVSAATFAYRLEAGGITSSEVAFFERSTSNADYQEGTAVFTIELPSGYSGEIKLQSRADTAVNPHTLTVGVTGSTTQLRYDVYKFPNSSSLSLRADETNVPWTQYNPIIGATTTAPTPNGSAIQTAYWRRVGQNMEIVYTFSQTAGGAAGSGTYLIPLPGSYLMDTNIITVDSGSIGVLGTVLGSGRTANTQNPAAATAADGHVVAHDASNLKIVASVGGNTLDVWSSTRQQLSGASYASFTVTVPIQGWGETNGAVLVPNSVATTFPGVIREESVLIEGSGSNTINQFGDWIVDPIVDNGAGSWTISIKPGVFSQRPHCQITVDEGNGNGTMSFDDDTTLSVLIRQTNTLGLLDDDFTITCRGPR